MVKSSCTQVKRQSALVIRVGVTFVNVRVSRLLKEELAWVIDKRFQIIIDTMFFKTVLPLRI